jgi:hypothetical protein
MKHFAWISTREVLRAVLPSASVSTLTFLPACRCGGGWASYTQDGVTLVLCASCRALAHPAIAAQVCAAAS